ncbi:MAG: GNAT family N-acetyltransferase, partial [Propionibacteriaceae bacterium]
MPLQIRRTHGEDWAAMKSIRLQALAEAPAAFGSTLEREQAFTEQTWRERVTTNLAFLAWLNGAVVGTATGYR